MARCNDCNKGCSKCDCEDLFPISTDDVEYTGSFLPNLNIVTGTNLTVALGIIDNLIGSLAIPNISEVVGGTATATADGVQRVFTIPHPLGVVPSGVVVNATDEDNSSNFIISFTDTQISIEYSVAPSQGDEISWSWIAVVNG